jgi:hypothetical protein
MGGSRSGLTPGYPTTYIPGQWGYEVRLTPPRPLWKHPWTPAPPNQRQIDILQQIAARRAQDEARRQAEQNAARERVQREARERAERERLHAAELQRLAGERERQQQVLAEQQHRLREADQARQRETLRRLQGLQGRIGAQRSTFLGTMLAGMAPPGIREYATRKPPEFLNKRGPELVTAQANRAASAVAQGMDNFSFWVNQAASVITGVIGMPGEYFATVGVAKAVQEMSRTVNTMVAQSGARLASTAGRSAAMGTPKSIDAVLMGCRDEASRITAKLAVQTVAEGSRISPQRYGEIVDALFKSLVQQARRDGLLPETIRTAPPALAISGRFVPKGGAVDVWDAATGIGWDITTARGNSVAQHDIRYLLGRLTGGRFVPPRKVMPDGTQLKDLRPLVYSR